MNDELEIWITSTLKDEIKGKEEKLERNEQLLATVQSENKKLAEPLRKAKEQLVELQRQLGSQEKEKSALISAQSKLKSSQKKVENLAWEVEVLQQKYDRAISKKFPLIKQTSQGVLECQKLCLMLFFDEISLEIDSRASWNKGFSLKRII